MIHKNRSNMNNKPQIELKNNNNNNNKMKNKITHYVTQYIVHN